MANKLPNINNQKGYTVKTNGSRVVYSESSNGWITVGKNNPMANFNTADYVDDGTAIQNAIDRATSIGYDVKILKGVYDIKTTITILDKSDFTIEGQSGVVFNIRLTYIPTPTNPSVTSLGGYQSGIYLRRCQNFRITNIAINTLDASPVIIPSFAIRIDACKNGYVNNIRGDVRYFGIFVDANTGENSDTIYIENNIINGTGNNDIIGGGTQNSSGACNVRNIIIRNNTLKHDLTSPLQFNGYPICIDLVRVDEICMSGNHTYGMIAFGSEQQPNRFSQISNNILKPAIGRTETAILAYDFPLTSSNITSGNYSITDNVMQDGFIGIRGKSTAPTEDIIVANNICSRIDIEQCNKSLFIGNRIKKAGSDSTAINIISSLDNHFANNVISNFTNGVANPSGTNTFVGNKYISVTNNTP